MCHIIFQRITEKSTATDILRHNYKQTHVPTESLWLKFLRNNIAVKFIQSCSQYLLNTNNETKAVLSKKDKNIVPVTTTAK